MFESSHSHPGIHPGRTLFYIVSGSCFIYSAYITEIYLYLIGLGPRVLYLTEQVLWELRVKGGI